MTRNAHTSTNGSTSNRLASRPIQHAPVRVDGDICLAMAVVMAGLFRRLMPDRYLALVQAALRRRAVSNYRLAQAADDAEDRFLGVLWQAKDPQLVHWSVGPDSNASPEDLAYAACGRVAGVSMRDPGWQHGLETDRGITCPHCRQLLAAAQASRA
jgi:hypothetical protein